MRRFLDDHLAMSLYAPIWLTLTLVVFNCCGLSH